VQPPTPTAAQALQAVIFDFDGTLADSYPAITASVNHVRALHGMPPLDEDTVRRHVGRGPVHLMEHTVPGVEVETAVRQYRAHHPGVMRSGTRLLPGVAETLAALHAGGLRLAVCSNKPRPFTHALLDYLQLAPLFAVTVGPEDAPRPKPAPDMLRLALTRLGVPAAAALYVGDMTVDIETARAAGVAVWSVPTGSDDRASLRAAGPDRLLDDFGDLRELVTNRRKT
jgi:phosphoglycolate phosphatase